MIEPKKIIAVFSLFAVASIALCACQSPSAPAQPTQTTAPAPQAQAQAAQPASSAQNPALTNPSLADAQAPQTFRARFSTTKGDFVVEVHRDWAPQGADRFYNLVKIGYFNGDAFFRVVKGFMVQFGINGSPAINAAWHAADIPDDPAVGRSNSTGMVTFATAGPNTRTTQIFINYGNNSFLDSQGFTPFGQIVEGMNVVESLYAGYGDGPPSGSGPDQGRLQSEGNSYLQSSFPNLDYVKTAVIEP
ncbi:MAG TPA: peptidylprolyl isomerase [Elusimicrobiota bacterium]|nr:peptidylprolyl isomerase [Elusimicrobiota bacterium]